jgi:mycofactocin system glycosyltransferase
MTLPMGFQVALAGDIRTADRGQLLVGGSPLTAMRLSSRAQEMLGQGRVTVTDASSAHLAERLLATNLGLPDLRRTPRIAALELTVVIPVRDRPKQLHRALAALRPLRCIVVDDASHSPEAVAEVTHRFDADLLQLPVNVGPAAARNAGLASVATPYVAFVDSDVEVTSADLLVLARHFADPAVSLVGPRVVGVARSPHPKWFERYDAVASSLTLGTTPGCVRPGAAVAWLPSACLIARTEALGTGFSADLRVGEDVDLVWRLVESGHRVRYDPSIEANHDARPTVRGWLGRKFVYGSGGAALAARHGDKLAPAVLTPSYAVGAAVLLIRRGWAVPVASAVLAVGYRSIRRSLPESSDATRISIRLAARGLLWGVRQESALLLRHWWPLAALGACGSRNVRRALTTALLVDSLALATRPRGQGEPIAFSTMILGRRLDDMSYGAGLWWGAFRAGSLKVLLPRRPAPAIAAQMMTAGRNQ